MSTTLIWGSPEWLTATAALAGLSALVLLWSYLRAPGRRSVRLAAALLKTVAFTALLLCLLEPLLSGVRPRRGANAFVILADNSQSMSIRDVAGGATRGDWLRERLADQAPWKTRLEQDFDVRRYVFDSQLRSVDSFDVVTFDGVGSSLTTALESLAKRFRGLPLAGVLVFTDGSRTDAGDLSGVKLPPVYPVIPPVRGTVRDIGIRGVSVSQTNFEAAPVVVRADVSAIGYRGQPVVAVVTDLAGHDLERQEATARDDKPLAFRFQFRPETRGLGFYSVRAFARDQEAKAKDGGDPAAGEQTSANNSRLIVVDQGGGPYRILYVGGRPDWEFKFLRRALDADDQVQLIGLIRLARKQPRFDFRSARDRANSSFFDGFEHPDPDSAERTDQPILVRLGTRDAEELRDGFPKSAEELFPYHAVVIDDLEAAFFTPDQLALLRTFVSQRGGGLLMLGGPDSFAEGKYDRTPVGDLLPVYLDRSIKSEESADDRFVLTREGSLEPWVRLRKTEDEEEKRLAEMPALKTINDARGIKPGAVVLAEARDASGRSRPALTTQPFGKGRTGALLIGGLWRWGLHRADPKDSDLERAWRQMIRWLVADVPARVEVSARPGAESGSPAVELRVRVRDAAFLPLDNAKVSLDLTLPGGEHLTLDASPDGREAGSYSASYVSRQPGAYRVVAKATAPDGAAVGQDETGWAAQPAADEFAQLEPAREWLQTLADQTGGEVVDGDRLASFVGSLAMRDAPITEPWLSPLWHQPLFFLVAIVCMAAEWGLRRVNGLP